MKKTTFIKRTPAKSIETVIGDEKQADFYPRVKIKKWNNEVNFSVGVIDTPDNATVTEKGDTIEWKKNDVVARFYPVEKKKAKAPAKVTNIRYIKAGYMEPVKIASYHELNRHIDDEQPTIVSLFPSKPFIAHYGFQPADKYFDLSKVDLPQIRLSSKPVNEDPSYMDKGLAGIDIHYSKAQNDLAKMKNSFFSALDTVLKRYNIELVSKDAGSLIKRYVKYNDQLVKVLGFWFLGGHFECYLNLDCDYNKSFSYFRDDLKPKTIEPAFGLRTINKDIPDSVIDEVIEEYAKLCGLPIREDNFTKEEQTVMSRLEGVQSSQDWILDAKRSDVWKTDPDEDENDDEGFEFEVDIPSKPANNIIPFSITTKGLNFYYQGELTDKELAKGSVRRPKIVGSYAVYHAEKKNNQYKTGKAFHIYRPIITDATGEQVYGDINVDVIKELLNVTIPQGFLDSAVYPVTVDPTFGYTDLGGSYQDGNNIILGNLFSGADGNHLSMSVAIYAEDSYATSTLKFSAALYTSTNNRQGKTEEFVAVGGGGGVWFEWFTLNFNSAFNMGVTLQNYHLYSWGTVTQDHVDWTDEYGCPQTTYYGFLNLMYDTTTSLVTSYSEASAYNYTTGWTSTGFTPAEGDPNTIFSIYVTYGFKYPIMVGHNASSPTVTAARCIALNASNTSTWIGTVTDGRMNVVAPVNFQLKRFDIYLNTAPGAGITRTFSPYVNNAATSVSIAIAGTAKSGTDITHYVDITQTDRISLGSTATATSGGGNPNRWYYLQQGVNQILFSTSYIPTSSTVAYYIGIQHCSSAGTGTGVAQVFPDAGILQNFIAYSSSALSGAMTYIVTVYISHDGGANYSSSGMTVTIDSSNQYIVDSSNTVAVAPGDVLYTKIDPNGTSPTAVYMRVSMEFVSSTPGNGVLLGGSNAQITSTSYNNWHSGPWDATESNVQALGYPLIIKRMCVLLGTTTGASKTRTTTFRNGGSDTEASVAITDGTYGEWSGKVTVADEALINVATTLTSSPASSTVKYGIVFSASDSWSRVPKLPLLGAGF